MMQIKDPEAPATPAQLSYLESLVSQRDNQTVAERYRLMKTLGAVQKGQASEWIDTLLTAPKKAAKTVTSEQMVQDFSAVVASAKLELKPQLTELPAFGYYMIGADLYYWDVTGKDAYPQLRKLSIVEHYSYSTGTYAKKGSWKKVYSTYSAPKVTATWTPYGGKAFGYSAEKTGQVRIPLVLADAVLGNMKPLSEDEAGQLGKQFGFCVRCGATLTDPVSVANGIGPVCAKYWM